MTRPTFIGAFEGGHSNIPPGIAAKGNTMKTFFKCSFIMMISSLFLAACSTPLFAAPTGTPTATQTATTTPIPTQTRTATPTQTLTATPDAAMELGEKLTMTEAGIAFRVPFGYASQIEAHQAFISDVEGTLVISFASVEDASTDEEKVIEDYLDAVARRGQGKFEKTASDPVTVNGIQGKAFDLTGSLSGAPIQGKTFAVPIGSHRFLFALAIANLSKDEAAWQNQGAEVFETIINSIEWSEPENAGTCPVSTDDTYGHTQENAIRVGDGGELFGGPARERAYLDNLRGPNGEPISYERTGSLNFEDTILDEYVITGLARTVTLYIDVYKFEELKAPVGFSCAGAFELQP